MEDLLKKLGKVLSEQYYSYATTMPQCPHWYVTQRHWKSNCMSIKNACVWMYRYGNKTYWGDKPYGEKNYYVFGNWEYGNVRYYFEFEGYRYFNCWIANNKKQPLDLINRARVIDFKSNQLTNDMRKLIDQTSWTYAKTMPKWKHEYIVKKNVCPKLFDDLGDFIDTFGYKEYFYNKGQMYYDIGDYTYWHMGNIINRCLKEDTYAQRKLLGTLPASNN